MRKRTLLLVMALACDGGTSEEDSGSCNVIDPSQCVQALSATHPEGQRWPSYSAASAALEDCSQYVGYWSRQQGLCSDGKRFLAKSSGFGGDESYFTGETLVGFRPWSDIVNISCGGCTPDGEGDNRCDVIEQTEFICR